MSSEAIFSMTFELNIEMKHNDTTGVKKVTSVGHLLSPTSFPILSTNASDCSANIKFLSTCEKLSNVYSGGYRTRNRFIVARTTFATIISKGRHIENKDVSRVSSTLWKKSSFTLRDYFEYLAKLEKTWWESSRRKKEYKSVNTAFDKLFIPYTILCSSSYGLVSFARTKPAPFSVIKLDSNFKIKKKKAAKSKIKVLPSYELGLATEDVFL